MMDNKFQFAIDRGGTFTDIYARCPGGKIRVMKLLSIDTNYKDAPTEGIRRILQEVHYDCL
jgi:5-oxoprolinase (ATP-hydrolysing)